MKKLFTLVAALLFAATVWAQSSSPKMSYQAVVRNAANELVVNRTDLTVEVSIKQADTVAFKETHTNVKTNQNGLLSLLIGDGTVIKGSLNDVDWTKAEFVTKINLGGESVTATAPATAVPYALYAESVNPNSEIINNIQGNITEIQGDINNIKENYLTKAGLCDSIKNCQTIKDMNSSIAGNAAAIEAIDGRIKTDSLKIVELYTTTMESVLGKIKSDSTALAGQISTNASEIANIKEKYLTISGLCDSIKSCPTITDIQGDITEITENYLTKAGLCDSVKKCPTITEIQGDILEIEGNITNLTNDYLTKAGLCDSIKSCPTITEIQENITKLQIDTVAKLKELIQDVSGDLSEYEIKNCDDVTACVNTALANASSTTNNLVDSIVDGHIKLADSLATESYVTSALGSYVTSERFSTTLADYYTANKIDDTLKNYATINKEKALTIKSLSNADSTKLLADTTLTIPEDFTLDADHLVKLYINGVYVGDNADGVLVVTDKKKVRYDYTKNGDYKLKEGDRIKILYWVKKN